MTITLFKLLAIVAVTNGVRAIGKRSGPRWGGLVLGLPVSTALVLFFLAFDRGTRFAADAADAGLFGLVAASAFAVATAWGLHRSGSLPLAALAGAAGFALAAGVLAGLPALALPPKLLVVAAGLAALAGLVARLGPPRGASDVPRRRCGPAGAALIRTAVPLLVLGSVLGLAGTLGPLWAGLLGAFPATLAAVLVVTAAEAGPAEAAALARAFPVGNLATLAFVLTFRATAVGLELPGAMLAGYLAAGCTLAAVEAIRRSRARASGPAA